MHYLHWREESDKLSLPDFASAGKLVNKLSEELMPVSDFYSAVFYTSIFAYRFNVLTLKERRVINKWFLFYYFFTEFSGFVQENIAVYYDMVPV